MAGSCLKQLERKCESKEAHRTVPHHTLPMLESSPVETGPCPFYLFLVLTTQSPQWLSSGRAPLPPAQRGSQRDWAKGKKLCWRQLQISTLGSRLCSSREFIIHLKDHLFPIPLLASTWGSTLALVISWLTYPIMDT